jgi:regulator of protease activity HflC (stomatin/prohibitin superfamily)
MISKFIGQIKALVLFLGVFLAFVFYQNCVKFISPGYVGVLINMLGKHKSDDQVLPVGFHCVAPWKRIYEFPIFEQNKTWEGERAFNFQTSEGMAVSADVGITYHLKMELIPQIFQKYRKGMHEITDIFIRNYIRDAINKAASHFKIESLYSSGKESFFDSVQKSVSKELSPLGIEVSRIYLIGRFHFPDNVIAALNSKIEANQRAQQRENEFREAEAEAKKRIAQADGEAKCVLLKAKSQAQANKIIAESVTPELIHWQAMQKWNGKLPQVTGGAIPMVDLKNFDTKKQ